MKTHARRTTRIVASLLCLVACGLAACGEAEHSEPSRPHVFLITIDTLRADHLGTYGYTEATSPNIDAFAEHATVFESALAQAPNTIPSILQIMTSRYGLPSRIFENQTSIADVMRDAGYETVAIVDNPLFEFDPSAHGLSQGFDQFFRNPLIDSKVLEQQHYKSTTPADVITAQARRYLDSRATRSPLFMWLHYFDPHDPYSAPFSDAGLEDASRSSASTMTGDIRREHFANSQTPDLLAADTRHIVNLYDDEIRYVDQSFGEWIEKLRTDGLYDESLIILSSDHGESFGEHGVWMHGRSLYESETHIPMIVKLPGQTRKRRVSRPVQAIDIFPTIVDVLSLDSSFKTNLHFDGESLLSESGEPALIVWLKHKVVRTEEWKLYETDREVRLFRIDEDPAELRDVAAMHEELIEELRNLRDARLARAKQSAAEIQKLSTETERQMRALGYIK